MKLTPWTLTVATFLMVGGIAVSYFFKNPIGGQLTVETKRVYFDRERTQVAARSQQANEQTGGPESSAIPGAAMQGHPTPGDAMRSDAAPGVITINNIDVADIVVSEPDKATRLIDPTPAPELVPKPLIAGHETSIEFGRSPLDVAVPLSVPSPVPGIEPPAVVSRDGKQKMPVVSEEPQPKTARVIVEKPASAGETRGFVTEQYRSVDRTDVRFVQGRAAVATQVAGKPKSASR